MITHRSHDCGSDAAGQESDGQDSVQVRYKASHRQACKSWEVPATFPDHKVLEAYASPSVDTNKTAFSFLKPDIELLRGYCMKVFGWRQVSLYSDCSQFAEAYSLHMILFVS